MASTFRNLLKQHLPLPLKLLVQRLRERVAPPPIDDVVLASYDIIADPSDRPRLTLVLPMLLKGSDFGGTATGIDIFCRLFLALNARQPIDLRVLVTDVVAETDIAILEKLAARSGIAIAPAQIELVRTLDARITVRAQEMFVTYNWWVTHNFAKVRDAQADLFAAPRKPIIWLIQDYEPAFWAFCSAYMLARETFETSDPLWAVINSGNLARYIEAMGHHLQRSFVFEPVILEALRPYLGAVGTSTRQKRILVYGRPIIERNCFPALVRGLRRWVRDYPEFADWELISAGVPHDPVDLGGGRKLVSVGKLALDDYAQLLLSCSAGVSLMASPHPSYPPLEMAHFGLRTVTNSFLCKDLSAFHPNIISTPSIAEAGLAAALAEACRRAATPPEAHGNPDYLREDTYPFMPELTDAVGAALVAPAG
jgi:O-antigen biosynthesis protein